MATLTQAEKALQLIEELRELNIATGEDLLQPSYDNALVLAAKSLKRRIAYEEFMDDTGPMPFAVI